MQTPTWRLLELHTIIVQLIFKVLLSARILMTIWTNEQRNITWYPQIIPTCLPLNSWSKHTFTWIYIPNHLATYSYRGSLRFNVSIERDDSWCTCFVTHLLLTLNDAKSFHLLSLYFERRSTAVSLHYNIFEARKCCNVKKLQSSNVQNKVIVNGFVSFNFKHELPQR